MEKTATDTHTRVVLRKLYGLPVAKVDSILAKDVESPDGRLLKFFELSCTLLLAPAQTGSH